MNKFHGTDSIIITILIFVIIWIFTIIPYKFFYLDPVAKAVGDFELNDIAFSKLLPPQTLDTNVILVNIGTLNRLQIAQQVKILNSFHPKVIAIDAIFNTKKNKVADSILSRQLDNCDNLILVGILKIYNEDKDYYEDYDLPLDYFLRNAVIGYANLPTKFGAHSKTIRSFRPYSKVKDKLFPSFAVRIVEAFDKSAYQELVTRANDLEIINFKGNFDKFITLDTDIIKQNLKLDFIKDKIVIIGFLGNSLSQQSLEDIYFTPLNPVYAGRSNPDMYGAVIHANIVSMILNKTYIDEIPNWVGAILAFIICYFNVVYIRYVRDKLTDFYGGIAKLLISTQTIIILFVNVQIFLIFQYKMGITLVLVGVIFVPSTVILYDQLIKHIAKSLKLKIGFGGKK